MPYRIICSSITIKPYLDNFVYSLDKCFSFAHIFSSSQDSANYEFSYEVEDAVAGLNFGHHESRKDNEATGTYHVLLPDGRTQIVDYVADGGGYRPMVRYEGTATYPAPGSAPRASAATAGSTSNEGYRY